jgi:bacteriorhodopsin
MFVATITFAGLSFTKPRSHRIFHYITAAITMVAAIAYFTMGADLGETGIKPEFIRPNNPLVAGNLREIFYVRYIDWYVYSPQSMKTRLISIFRVITTPLLLLDLLLTAGMPWPTILYTLLIDEIMVITGLVGALVTSSYKACIQPNSLNTVSVLTCV